MTIDIIAAAQSEREDKIGQLQTCRDQVRKLTDEAIRLQLDVIEIDAFIAKARSYAGDGETDTTAPKPLPEDQGDSATESIAPEHQPTEAKTVDQEPLSNGSGGVQDGLPVPPANPIPTIPQPQEGEETGAVAEPAPVKRATKYERVLEALRKNPKANARALQLPPRSPNPAPRFPMSRYGPFTPWRGSNPKGPCSGSAMRMGFSSTAI